MPSIHFGNYIIESQLSSSNDDEKMTIDFRGLNRVIINNYQVEETPLSILKLLREISSRIHQTQEDDNLAKIKHFQNSLISELGQTPYWELEEYLSAEFKEFIIHFPNFALYHLINLIQKVKKFSNNNTATEHLELQEEIQELKTQLSYNQTETEQLQEHNMELQEEIQELKTQLSNISYNQTETEQLQEHNMELQEEIQELKTQLSNISYNHSATEQLQEHNRELQEEIQELKNKLTITDKLQKDNRGMQDIIQVLKTQLSNISYNHSATEQLKKDNRELRKENKELKGEIEDFLEMIKGYQTNLEKEKEKNRGAEESFIELSISHNKIRKMYTRLLQLNTNIVKKTKSLDFFINKICNINKEDEYTDLMTVIEVSKFIWCANMGKRVDKNIELEDRTKFYIDLYNSCNKKKPEERTQRVKNIIASQEFWRNIEDKYNINDEMFNYAWHFMKHCTDEEILLRSLPRFLFDIQQMLYLKNYKYLIILLFVLGCIKFLLQLWVSGLFKNL